MKSLIKILIIFFILIQIQPAFSSHFHTITVPGAYCGNGQEYKIFIKKKKSKKIVFEFMGGGACWSKETCFGPKLRAWIYPIPRLATKFSVLSSDNRANPFYDYTKVYLPYCTGDMFAGDHIAKYRNKRVFHYGKRNMNLTLKTLKLMKYINFESIEDLVIAGSSAGALGALLHAKTISTMSVNAQKKTLIADSPGLHWKPNIWSQFPKVWVNDITNSINQFGIRFNHSRQILAEVIPDICSIYNDFNIGFLQGTKDIVMSRLFGKISPKEHEEIIFSDIGLFSSAQRIKNCVSWLPDTYMHTFILTYLTSYISSTGKTAIDFIKEVHEGKQLTNY
ncbi:MAG: hypothetical protein KC493_16685 [Bacteriovoracaceae bacterium]|nr:hypothetical protein [Bacteriovoracaceae bacterium]